MTNRMGERIGWIAGWLGGFLWVAVLAVVFLGRARWGWGLAGLALAGLAVACVLGLAPWRHPATPYWKLMVPLYVLLLASAAWAIGAFGAAGLEWWSVFWILPVLLPLGTMGRRTWRDMSGRPGTPADGTPAR